MQCNLDLKVETKGIKLTIPVTGVWQGFLNGREGDCLGKCWGKVTLLVLTSSSVPFLGEVFYFA